jgi:hypothetical protein
MATAQVKRIDISSLVERLPSTLWQPFLSAYNSLPVSRRNALGRELIQWAERYRQSHEGSWPPQRRILEGTLGVFNKIEREHRLPQVVFAISQFENELRGLLGQVPQRR